MMSSATAAPFSPDGRPAQRGPHPGDELAEPERLRDVVVGTDLEPDDGVDLGVARGDHDDRHLRTRPDLATHVDARHLREHHVEQHERRADGVELVERLDAVGRGLDEEALALQRDGQRVAIGLLVVDDEDRGGIGHHPVPDAMDRSDGMAGR